MKIYFDVKNQIITRTDRNQVIANSADYLEAEITFSAEWATMEKTMTFKNGNLLYTYVLVNNKILEENHLNLGVGTWKVSIQGVYEDKKIVTNECNLAVNASGWIGSEALPPESIWNQLLVIIQSLHTEVASTAALRSAVQKYIEDNYDALVKEAVIVDDVRAALDDMAEDGTLSDLLAPLVAAGMPEVVADQISAVVAAQIGGVVANQIGAVVASQITTPVNQAVKNYCDDNFSGWSGALDRGLTQPLMAAPADMVGEIKSALTYYVTGYENFDSFVSGVRTTSNPNTIASNNTKLTTAKIFELKAGDVISVNGTYNDLKYAIAGKASTNYDSGWKTENFSYTVINEGTYFVNVSKSDGTSQIIPSDATIYVNVKDGSSRISDITRMCYLVPPATSLTSSRIKVYESYITIPFYTKVIFNDNNIYNIPSTITVNRIAYGSSALNSECLIFNVSNKTFRFIDTNTISTLDRNDRIVATFKYGMNGCSLPEKYVEFDGLGDNTEEYGEIVPPSTNQGRNFFIEVETDKITIPQYTRIFYGKDKQYTLASSVTVTRVAYGSSSANNELLLFNYTDKTFRFVNGNLSNPPVNSEIILATFKYGNFGSSLPEEYVYWKNGKPFTTEINALNPVEKVDNLINAASQTSYINSSTPIIQRAGILNLLHFSDIHGDTSIISRIIEFFSAHSDKIHDIIHTGDSPLNHYEDSNPFDTVGGSSIMNVVGNHDYWKNGGTWPHPYNATQQEVYEKFISPYISYWSVESAGVNKNYYYKDYTTANIRLIILDSVIYDSAQSAWFDSVLADAITNDLYVICATHYPPQPGVTKLDCSFTTKRTIYEPAADPAEGAQFEYMPNAAFNSVDTFIGNNGKFICWLAGHTHYDIVGIVNNHINQIYIEISTANPGYNADSMARVNKTKSADLFNVVSVDTTTETLSVIRIGADVDKYMRGRNRMSIDYANKTVIFSD